MVSESSGVSGVCEKYSCLHNGCHGTTTSTRPQLEFLKSHSYPQRSYRDVEKSIWCSCVFFSDTDGVTRRGRAAQRGDLQTQVWTATTDRALQAQAWTATTDRTHYSCRNINGKERTMYPFARTFSHGTYPDYKFMQILPHPGIL
jgi:hypothetical protein